MKYFHYYNGKKNFKIKKLKKIEKNCKIREKHAPLTIRMHEITDHD